MWKFNVIAGSISANLTNPFNGIIYWTIGPSSSDSWYLNGTGVASFNWTAPISGVYQLNIQSLNSSQWSTLSGATLSSVCDVQVWEFYPLTVVFNPYD